MRVLIALATILTLGQIQRADQEVLLIPQGFTGDIFIVYRVQSGQPAAREGSARLYRIPSNGMLATQEPPNSGMGPVWKFYYESAQGERQPLGRIWTSTVPRTPENEADPAVEVFYPRHGRQQRSEQVPCDVEFDTYFIGTRAQAMSHSPVAGPRKLGEFLKTAAPCGPLG